MKPTTSAAGPGDIHPNLTLAQIDVISFALKSVFLRTRFRTILERGKIKIPARAGIYCIINTTKFEYLRN